jgi:hypothetical protein
MTTAPVPSKAGNRALVASAITFLIEVGLLGSNIFPADSLVFPLLVLLLPIALVATIILCIVAGARSQRRKGLIGGVLILLPALFATVVIVIVATTGAI